MIFLLSTKFIGQNVVDICYIKEKLLLMIIHKDFSEKR